jgi:hypothetical protein
MSELDILSVHVYIHTPDLLVVLGMMDCLLSYGRRRLAWEGLVCLGGVILGGSLWPRQGLCI